MSTRASLQQKSEEVQSNQKAVPFAQELFVDRTEETTLFKDTVRATTGQTYLEFTGVAGQGKSELLKWIYHNAKTEGQKAEKGYYFATYIDFEDAQYHRPEIYAVLDTIVDQLPTSIQDTFFQTFKEKLSPYIEQLRQFHLDSWADPKNAQRTSLKHTEDDLIAEFKKGLGDLLAQHKEKMVFCLDSTEKAYRDALRNFEEHVLKDFTGCKNFMLVTAGQEGLVWKHDEIRNLVKHYDLPRLNKGGVQEQVKKLASQKGFNIQDDDLVINKIMNLTKGHPFSNYKLVNFLTDDFQKPLNKTIAESSTIEKESIKKLIKQVIEDRILEKFQLSEAYPAIKDVLWYLAPLRHIELGMLQYVLTTFLSQQFKAKPIYYFSTLMGELQRTYIFTRWHFGRGYGLDPVVRNLLLWDMRLNSYATFLDLQKKLAERYKELISKTTDVSRIKYIVEQFYHQAILSSETHQKNLMAVLETELQQYLTTYFMRSDSIAETELIEQLDHLCNALKTDEDLPNYGIEPSRLITLIEKQKALLSEKP